MKGRTKQEMIRELNQILLVKDIAWHLLPEADLAKLFEAFQRLKGDIDEIFTLLDEAPVLSTENPQKTLEKMKSYVV